MLKLIGAVACFAWMTGAGSAGAQELWRGSQIGMSVSETSALLPEAQPTTGSALRTGEAPLLKVGGFELADEPFAATFFFKDDRLSRVILEPEREVSRSTSLHLARRLIALISVKYGSPFDCEERQTSSIGVFTDCNWLSSGTAIQVYGADSDIIPPNAFVSYSKAVDSSPDL